MTTVAEQPAQRGQSNTIVEDQQYVSFLIDGELMGVPVSRVQEVLASQQIAQTPLARNEVAGLLNLRGQIVTAVNLRRRLGLPDRAPGETSMNVVVRYQGESFSLLVDEVGDVISVAGLPSEPPPRTLDARWRALVNGVFRLEQGLFVVLDLTAILTLTGSPLRSGDSRN